MTYVRSYGQAREIMKEYYCSPYVTSPEGYENDRYFKVPVDCPREFCMDDDCVRLVSKETGAVIPIHAFPFDDEGRKNIEMMNRMTPVYDEAEDSEYISLLKRYRSTYGRGYFSGEDHELYGATARQVMNDIRKALA
ncbi:hypothetical protein KIH77_03400 [Bifidobacterium sp. 82T24]|uniref:hypothetical protein n=1 Tax=Bifidobacterium pluvialisilvae TaxID=2834436 RepID=UPI001C579C25|nr:hypothetical protein [Bifidobacterium pluvialisilvae]MBW3087782.1 hypothetical protein [Bifidobacterium pluvialisilvae]